MKQTEQPDTAGIRSTVDDLADGVDRTFRDLASEMWEFLGTAIFKIQETEVTIGSILVFLTMVMIFVLAGKLVSRLLYRRVLKKVKMEEATRYTLQRLTNYAIIILGTIFSFQFVGIELGGLAVIFGLLSVGIGFGLQNLTSNFISGIILLFERPISVGDRVIVNDTEGDVQEINIRSTRINSLNNISIIVPNSDFIEGRVINYSHGDKRIRIDIEVGVSYNSDLDLVLDTIRQVAVDHPFVLEDPAPDVLLKNFGDSSWDMLLRCWIPDPYKHPKIQSDLRCALVRKFREKGIEIPFPQRDLHVRSPLPVPHVIHQENGSSETAKQPGQA